jgi:hypothetical protein
MGRGIIFQKMEREDDRYIFLHRTFQEYLTASYLKRMGNGVDLARKHFWEYDWHETLASFAGLMDDPVPLLQTIMKQKDDIFSSMLLLAGRCVTECQGVSHPLTEDIVDRIYALWRKYPDAAFVSQTIVGVGQVMPRMLANLQEALGEREYEVAHKAARVIRKIGTDEAVDVLIGAVGHQSFCVRGSAIIELREIGGRKVVHALTKALNDAERHVREMSANTLASMGGEGVSALIQALEHKERDIRRVVAKALSDEAFFEAPTEALDDKHRYVREIALDALVQAL